MAPPATTITDAGTGRAALFEESATVAAPVRAAGDNVTVQLVVVVDTIELGEQEMLETAGGGGATVTEVIALPFRVAVRATV